jgi:hypothetical protein
MEIVIGCVIVLAGVVFGMYTRAGSEISERPTDDRLPDPPGEPFDAWSRGTR